MSTIETTTDYAQFNTMDANREVNRGHVETLKRAIEEIGDLTASQPILVNENFEIIDGQHRFTACSELGLPIHYTKVEGLGVSDARRLNIVHRGWEALDYAKSYAAQGDPNYVRFMQLVEDYGDALAYTTLVRFVFTLGTNSPFKKFRNGELAFDEQDDLVTRSKIEQYIELCGAFGVKSVRGLVMGFITVSKNPDYDHKRMVKSAGHAQHLFRKYSNVDDNLRMLEDVYNYNKQEANRVRFF
jgi:hypothetical protein